MADPILEVLDRLVSLLEEYQVRAWLEHIKYLRNTYQKAIGSERPQDKQFALEEIMNLFGGMGSFSDYTITHLHDDMIEKEQEYAVNKYLDNLRHKLCRLMRSELLDEDRK